MMHKRSSHNKQQKKRARSISGVMMGLFDTLVDGSNEAQVKLFKNELRIIKPGQKISFDVKTFSVALREGGYAIFRNKIFIKIKSKPLVGKPVFDKYGDRYSKTSLGLIGENYYIYKGA